MWPGLAPSPAQSLALETGGTLLGGRALPGTCRWAPQREKGCPHPARVHTRPRPALPLGVRWAQPAVQSAPGRRAQGLYGQMGSVTSPHRPKGPPKWGLSRAGAMAGDRGTGQGRWAGRGDTGRLFCIQGPLGLSAGQVTREASSLAWESSVSTQPVPRKQGLGPMGAGRGGPVLGASLSSSTPGGGRVHAGPVCRAAWCWERPFPATERPPGGPGTAAMRSQESVRGSPRPGPGWVGRGSRKVLRIWVSGWCGAKRAGPGRGCYEHPNTAFAACRMLPAAGARGAGAETEAQTGQ